MKELTSYNRVAGYLNKIFDLLNSRFFESELSRPTITIQSTPKALGYFLSGTFVTGPCAKPGGRLMLCVAPKRSSVLQSSLW